MCGPPDFAALSLCVTRLAELSAAGLTAYSVYKTASLCRKCRPKSDERERTTPGFAPGGLMVKSLSQ